MIEEIKATVATIDKLEKKILQLKEAEAKFEEAKKQLYQYMIDNNFDHFDTKALRFTLVRPSTSKTEVVIDFDLDRFKKENPLLYHKYLTTSEKVSKPRAGYLKMSIKEEE